MRKRRLEVTWKGDRGSFGLLSRFAFRRVLAKSRQPILPRVQAREGEAEKLRLSFRHLDCSCFDPPFLCSVLYCVRFGARLRGKWLPSLKRGVFAKVRRQETAEAEKALISAARALRLGA
jgi:hypothetical protein